MNKLIDRILNSDSEKLSALERAIGTRWDEGFEKDAEQAAQELAAKDAAIEAAKELAQKAQAQLRSTQINWQESCLFDCDDLLTGVIAALEKTP